MRYLHTMLRVVDLDRSIRFYTEALGLKLHSRQDYPEGKFTLAFLGEGPPAEGFLELTHNWETPPYEKGTAYGHMAFGVKDIYAVCERLASAGTKITPAARPHEARQDRHRLRRGPRRLQGGAHRAALNDRHEAVPVPGTGFDVLSFVAELFA